MTDYSELVKKLRDLHRDPRPASAEWLFENQVALYDAAAAIEELSANVADKDHMIQEQWDEIQRLRADVKRQQKKMIELAKKLPKRGEWIDEDLDNFRKYKVTCPHCGAWYVGNYDAYVEPWDFNYCPHCGNICNQTNIEYENKLKEQEKEARANMEVQDADK